MREYGLESLKSVPNEKFDTIVLTVSHNKFSELDFLTLNEKNAVIYYVNNFLKNDLADGNL